MVQMYHSSFTPSSTAEHLGFQVFSTVNSSAMSMPYMFLDECIVIFLATYLQWNCRAMGYVSVQHLKTMSSSCLE